MFMKKLLLIIFIAIILLAFLFFGGMYLRARQQTKKEEDTVQEVSRIVFHPTTQEDGENNSLTEIEINTELSTAEPSTEISSKEEAALHDGYDYEALIAENPDCIGWITIPDTSINRPVMWRENDNSYYLNKDVYGNYARHGTPFIDGFCDPIQGNLIIYGHNTLDYAGFGSLINYTSYEFYRANPNINFYIQKEKCVFEIFAVCKISAQNDKEYYEYYGLENEADLQNFLDSACRRSIYDTGICPSVTDRILVLSTCEYSQQNGRLVILAREIVE